MLGNDIVDYGIDEKKCLNQRFINRVLSQTEIECLSQSNNQNAFLWSLWAAKEASFKACQKTALQTIFSPSQFELEQKSLKTLLDNDFRHDFKQPIQAALTFQDQVIHLLFSWPNQTTVHCVAFIGSIAIAKLIKVKISNQWDERVDGNQSSQVRAVANTLLQQNHLSAQIERPILAMPGYHKPGPPVLINSVNEKLPHEISLSHDGTWLAVALLCR